MKDYLGNEISVGDKIVACVSHGRNSGASLVTFIVTGLTDKFVKGNIPCYTNSLNRPEDTKITPRKCVVIEKKSND